MAAEPLYYAEGRNIYKRPIETKADGVVITIGFRCAVATDEVGEEGAKIIAALMNMGDRLENLAAAAQPIIDQFTAVEKTWIDPVADDAETFAGPTVGHMRAFRAALSAAREG